MTGTAAVRKTSKWSARDLVPCVNLFSKVYIEEDGSMHFEEGHCKEGATVTLRTEMDMIFIVSNTPNPLDPAKEFPSVPVSIEVYDAPEVDLTDECVNYRPEKRQNGAKSVNNQAEKIVVENGG